MTAHDRELVALLDRWDREARTMHSVRSVLYEGIAEGMTICAADVRRLLEDSAPVLEAPASGTPSGAVERHVAGEGLTVTSRVLLDIGEERRRQDAKWGEQNHDLTVWMTVLGEEYGETCHAVLHHRAASGRAENVEGDTDPDGWLDKVRREAIQTAAVATAIVEFIDRGCLPSLAALTSDSAEGSGR